MGVVSQHSQNWGEHQLVVTEGGKICRNAPSKDLSTFWGFHKWGYPNSWMVYKGKSHQNGMMTGGTPIFRKPPYRTHITQEFSMYLPFQKPPELFVF